MKRTGGAYETSALFFAALGAAVLALAPAASAQTQRCEIPREARDIWHCENGFVIGPENVIIRLPIPETDPEALYNAGVEAAQRQDWRVAIAYFTAAQQRAHLVPRYMYNLGLAHARAGHEAAAIAWFAAYLVAEPNAPNRSAVWRQIAQLESDLAAKQDAIRQQSYEAALLLPDVPEDEYDQSGARSNAFRLLSDVMLRNGDRMHAGLYATISDSHLLPGSPIRPIGPITAETQHSTDEPLPWPCEGVYSRFSRVNYVCPTDYTGRSAFDVQVLQAIARGDRARTVTLLNGWTNDNSGLNWSYLALVLNGRSSEARAQIAALNGGFMGNLKEDVASSIGETLLRFGDMRGARQFAELAQQFSERERQVSISERGQGGLVSGFLAARLQSLILAEEGDWRRAIETLTIYTSRRLTTWPTIDEAHSLESLWLRHSSDAGVAVAEFLFDRGRYEDALSAAAVLDSYTRSRLFNGFVDRASEQGLVDTIENARVNTLQASGANGMAESTRASVEESERIAVALPGVCYDLDWWLRAAARGDFANSGRWRAQTSISPDILILAVAGLGRGQRAVRSAYEHTGAVWMQ